MPYDLWRKIHLYTGFVLLAFVFMYFFTGYPIIHGSWFPESNPVEKKRSAPVRDVDIAEDPYAYSDYFQEAFGLVGTVIPPADWKDGRWRFSYNTPRLWPTATVDTRTDSVQISVTERSLTGVLITFHRMHGYFGGWLFYLWAFLYDLASISMLVFAATGVTMWYRLSRAGTPARLDPGGREPGLHLLGHPVPRPFRVTREARPSRRVAPARTTGLPKSLRIQPNRCLLMIAFASLLVSSYLSPCVFP